MIRHAMPCGASQVATLVRHALMTTDEEGFALQSTGKQQPCVWVDFHAGFAKPINTCAMGSRDWDCSKATPTDALTSCDQTACRFKSNERPFLPKT